jgi:hypothetical protein
MNLAKAQRYERQCAADAAVAAAYLADLRGIPGAASPADITKAEIEVKALAAKADAAEVAVDNYKKGLGVPIDPERAASLKSKVPGLRDYYQKELERIDANKPTNPYIFAREHGEWAKERDFVADTMRDLYAYLKTEM